jgi:4-amino-4-deoxy-L-arabinose transferase-like glycosyltransferase
MAGIDRPSAHADCRVTSLRRRAVLSRRASAWWRYPAAMLIGVVFFVPGLFHLPPIDRDEPRFAQASRQMLESGTVEGWIVPHVQDRPRLNKPPLIYWLQATGATAMNQLGFADELRSDGLLTGGIWKFRLPSLLCGLVTLTLTLRIAARMYGPVAGLLAVACLASSTVMLVDVRLARADQLMLMLAVASMDQLHLLYERFRNAAPISWLDVLPLWVLIGLSTMSKGPIVLMMCGLSALTIAAFADRKGFIRTLRPAIGALCVLLICTPWLVMGAREVGWGLMSWNILRETGLRAVLEREGHGGLPGYYFVVGSIAFWPGSVFVLPALVQLFRRGLRLRPSSDGPLARVDSPGPSGMPFATATFVQRRGASSLLGRARSALQRLAIGRAADFFLLAWIVPTWLAFEVFRTKLPHYVLPIYPALAIVVARLLMGGIATLDRPDWLARWTWRLSALMFVIGITICIAYPIALAIFYDANILKQPAILILWIGFSIALLIGLRQRLPINRAMWLLGATACHAAMLLHHLLPTIRPLWTPSIVVARMQRHGLGTLAMADYEEDSLIFLSRGVARQVTAHQADELLRKGDDCMVVMPFDADRTAPQSVTEREQIPTLNYSRGDWLLVDVLIIAAGSDAPAEPGEVIESGPENRASEEDRQARHAHPTETIGQKMSLLGDPRE